MENLNAKTIEQELDWLELYINQSIKSYINSSQNTNDLIPPSINNQNSSYAQLIEKYNMTEAERLVLILALAPHVKPSVLDIFFSKNNTFDRPFTEFGGITHEGHYGFLPTGETVMFLLTANDIEKRFKYMSLFNESHYFHTDGILSLAKASQYVPEFSGQLALSEEYVSLLAIGRITPEINSILMANKISTDLNWEDLIMSDTVLDQIGELKIYVKQGEALKRNHLFGKKIKSGFRVLFSGPSGTGKTLTATLLGKFAQRDVYRIDLSLVVSKYIGETEKNLAKLFNRAESNNWILFFDEADALFGKRTEVASSNDRYANQEVSYLLQRIEDFNGLVILSSNFKNNIDDGFLRRFQSIVQFKLPDAAERFQLWKRLITDEYSYSDDLNIENLAENYELSPGSIINILHKVMLKSLDRGDRIIQKEDLLQGIKQEFRFKNRAINLVD